MGLFDKKTAIVIGASVPGSMGAAIAQRFINEGANVIISARSEDKLNALAEEIGASARACDITSEEQVKVLAEFARDKFGKLDVAVNCVGEAVMGDIANTEEAAIRRAVDVHYIGPFFFLKHMSAAIGENGSIITISSITASRVINNHAAYVGAKAGTDHLVRVAAIEFGRKNIRVNSVSPGFTITPMSESFVETEGLVELFEKEIPLGRLNTVDDVAQVVSWLSHEDSYITGQNIQVNGGHSLTRMPSKKEFIDLFK